MRPSVERIREVLSYNPETGEFHWRVTLSARRIAGSLAGEVKDSGYRLIGVDGARYRAHRLAFVYMNGEWPADQVDHVNCNRSDNRWVNLRAATNQQNGANRGANRNNKSGYKGVSWNCQRGKWAAKITLRGRQKHLGFFTDPAAAGVAYAVAAKAYFGEYGRA